MTVRRRSLSAQSALSALTAVLTVLVLGLVAAPAVDASPASLQQREWWIGRLGLRQVWSISKGSGVTVAVIDTGVDTSVPDLQGAVVPGFSVADSGSPNVAHDAGGHGTSMAIDIAGRGREPGILGVAPQAKIMPVYLPDTAFGDTATALNRLSAMSRPPQIVSMSYGVFDTCPDDLQAAVARAVARGMILVASAGNSGDAANESQFPANCKGVVAVGAFDADGAAWSGSQRQPYVSIGGPGVNIVTYNRARQIGTNTGTSPAAAIVAGELALLRSHFPSIPPRQLVARLFATASKSLYHGPRYGQSGDVLGFGPAVIQYAMTRSVPATAPNPVYDDLAAAVPTAAPSSPASASTPTASPGSGMPTGDVGVSFPGSGAASAHKSGGSSSGFILAAVGAAVVLVLGVTAVAVRRRNADRSR